MTRVQPHSGRRDDPAAGHEPDHRAGNAADRTAVTEDRSGGGAEEHGAAVTGDRGTAVAQEYDAAVREDHRPAGLVRPVRTDGRIEQLWERLHRWVPYALLTLATLLALATRDLVETSAQWYAVGALVCAAALLQLWWDWNCRRSGRARHTGGVGARGGSGPHGVGMAFYTARWSIAFVLTLINPLFALYAATGYFDADELFTDRRIQWLALTATAATLAGAQSGGLPLRDWSQAAIFVVLLIVNSGLWIVVGHLTHKEEERSRARADTIDELERTNTALQQALDENAALHAQLLLQAREAGVADERRRLAAEIHDTLAQGLTGIIAQLQVVANSPDPAQVHTHACRALELARHSLGEARRSVHNLAPVALAHDGLPDALKKTVADWSERTGTRADFLVTGTGRQLHDELAATLLRIAQEALSNAARHSRADRVGVTLSFMGDEVTLDIRDNGVGFDPLALPERFRSRLRPGEGTPMGGFGLDGMRARAERVAGSLMVESEPGQGTAVSARVPLVVDER